MKCCIFITTVKLSVIWYIACEDWLIRTSTTDVHVTLPTNSRQVWRYPQNIKFVPIFLLVTSHFLFWTYQSLKKSMWVRRWGMHVTDWCHGLIGIFESFAIVDLKMTSSGQKTVFQFLSNLIFHIQFRSC